MEIVTHALVKHFWYFQVHLSIQPSPTKVWGDETTIESLSLSLLRQLRFLPGPQQKVVGVRQTASKVLFRNHTRLMRHIRMTSCIGTP